MEEKERELVPSGLVMKTIADAFELLKLGTNTIDIALKRIEEANQIYVQELVSPYVLSARQKDKDSEPS